MISRTGWDIRPFRDQDESEIVSLLSRAFSADFTPEWFRWSYRSFPFGKPILLVAESSNGEIIGFQSSRPWPLTMGHQTIVAYQTGDLCVHPDYRGRGIMFGLGKQVVEESERRGGKFVFGFSNENSVRAAIKLGYQVVDHMMPRVWVKRPIHLFYHFLVRPHQNREKNVSASHEEEFKYFFQPLDYIDEITQLQARYDPSRLRLLRSKTFYTWRFNRPQCLYQIVSVGRKNPSMVVQILKSRFGMNAFILEQYVPTHSLDWKRAITAILSLARTNSIYTLYLEGCGGWKSNLLEKILYRFLRSCPTLIVKGFDKETNPFLSRGKWDLNPLDMDFC